MSVPPGRPSLPGAQLHRLARRLFDPATVRARIEPAIADLQYEARGSVHRGLRQTLQLRGGYAACVLVILVNLLSGRPRMRTSKRTWLAVAACMSIASVLATMSLPLPHFLFALSSLVFLLPIVEATATAGARWSLRRALTLACSVVPAGYAAGGLAGWAAVPSAWTASLWVTIDASMNAATYGSSFEHAAERVLLYMDAGGIAGALVSAAAVVVSVGIWGHRTAAASRVRPWVFTVTPLLCLLALPLLFVNRLVGLALCAGVALTFFPVWEDESAALAGRARPW